MSFFAAVNIFLGWGLNLAEISIKQKVYQAKASKARIINAELFLIKNRVPAVIYLGFHLRLCYNTQGFCQDIGDRLIPLLKPTYSCTRNTKMASILCLAVVASLSLSALAADALQVQPAVLDYTNTYALSAMDPNLTGKGTLIGAVCASETYSNGRAQDDYRFNMNHQSLSDADVMFPDGTDGRYGISSHATSIAGILLGVDRSASYPDLGRFEYRGACPDASVNVYEFNQFLARLFGGLPIEEDILVLSLGDMFESWWVRALERAAAENDFLVVASNGNGSSAQTPMPLYPAAGSNVLSVGVINALTDADGNISVWDFSTPKAINSSSGPTEDRRCKPDIVAPGTALVPSGIENDDYVLQRNWSSLAGPVVAGTAALLEQKALSDASLKAAFDQPGKSLVLKAVLMNSARKLPYWHKGLVTPDDDPTAPLDYAQGAGVLDALAAYNQLTAGMGKPGEVPDTGWDNRVLQTGDWGYEYGFEAKDPNQMITATLCWNRVYQNKYPFNHELKKDADFRLELWGVDPNDPTNNILLDYSDSVNDNVEHLYFACDPNYTAYAVRVKFNTQQPDEPPVEHRFAVAWSVGPDRQADNPWWYDLNADDKAYDGSDNLIYSLIESELIDKVEMSPLLQTLGVSPDRLQLLTAGWATWKPYLANWVTPQTVTPDLIRGPDGP